MEPHGMLDLDGGEPRGAKTTVYGAGIVISEYGDVGVGDVVNIFVHDKALDVICRIEKLRNLKDGGWSGTARPIFGGRAVAFSSLRGDWPQRIVDFEWRKLGPPAPPRSYQGRYDPEAGFEPLKKAPPKPKAAHKAVTKKEAKTGSTVKRTKPKKPKAA